MEKTIEKNKLVKTNIDEAIARIESWKGRNIKYELLTKGITNPNYKVTVDDKDFFLKIQEPELKHLLTEITVIRPML